MITTYGFNIEVAHPSWRNAISEGLNVMDPTYLQALANNHDWLPGPKNIFNAFSLPIDKINYLLFGESPYPRRESANGYAFWDAAVKELWTESGMSKRVNRATSLRNIMKMLLVADNALTADITDQETIAKVNKQHYVQTNTELFENFIRHGFLLLNSTLVLQKGPPMKDAKAWYPFMKHILEFLLNKRPDVALILFGRIANSVDKLINCAQIKRLYAEHPYNHTFIKNSAVLDFFRPLRLLNKTINS